MDEKSSISDNSFDEACLAQKADSYNARKGGRPACFRGLTTRRICYTACIVLIAWFILHTIGAPYWGGRLPTTKRTAMTEKNATKVALEAHIMSKCPDAKACLEKLIVPAMAQISDKVDFRLSYIGRSVALFCNPAIHILTGHIASTPTPTPSPASMALPSASAT
jgi:hypothetical protein